jgi:NAD-dependent SIR2 family protein deacetylase
LALPCISSGLFGFPQDQAATIALQTVRTWLEGKHRDDVSLTDIVFVVFTDIDQQSYQAGLQQIMTTAAPHHETTTTTPPAAVATAAADNDNDVNVVVVDDAIRLAAQLLDRADAVLIVAGAGMSGNPGEIVYTNPDDFVFHYPWFTKWGYHTGYEAMGLLADPSVPETAKWAFWATHMDKMRWQFVPNAGYDWLSQLVHSKEYFIHTSNVDGYFARAAGGGFDAERIYTPQGEWTYLQCMNGPCRPDAVFAARPYLDAILPKIDADGFIPHDAIPHCPHCGGGLFGNVRGGKAFLHHEVYEQQSASLERWIDSLQQQGKSLVVLEIGAGFNTPTVTRFLSEAVVRAMNRSHDNAKDGDDHTTVATNTSAFLIRINPTEPEVPPDIPAIAIRDGWQVLQIIQHLNHQPNSTTTTTSPAVPIRASTAAVDTTNAAVPEEEFLYDRVVRPAQRRARLVYPPIYLHQVATYGGGGENWRRLLQQLRSSHSTV